MADKRRIVVKLLTYLLIIISITFNINQVVLGHENISKKDMDLKKLNEDEILYASHDYEEIRNLMLNYKDIMIPKTYEDNLHIELPSKVITPNNESFVSPDDYITYYEFEPNDTMYSANMLNTRYDGSLKYIMVGTITDYYFDIDYYKINLNKSGVLDIMGLWGGNVAGNGWEDDLGIGLKNSNGDLLLAASLRGYGADTYRHLLTTLSPGTYYIMVIQMSDYQYLYTDEPYGLAVDFKPISNISFNSMGGSYVSSTTANSGDLIIAPTSPTKYGYTFGGWYKESSLINIWNFSSDMVLGDTILYAKWIPNKYIVSFNSNGASDIASISVDYNSLIKIPHSPIKSGYAFEGWYKDSTLNIKWDFNNDKVTGNLTLYSKWKKIDNDFVLNLDGKTKVFKEKQTTTVSKTWTIEFNKSLDLSTINSTNIFIWNQTDKIYVDSVIQCENNKLTIVPLQGYYTPNKDYVLYITANIKSINSNNLKQSIKLEFNVQ